MSVRGMRSSLIDIPIKRINTIKKIMAAAAKNIRVPETNILQAKNTDDSQLVGVCSEIEKQLQAVSRERRDVQHPATTLPTCCPRYPPGSTLLECRFEGDQPVAHIVQIPGDRCTATQKINLLVETKATKFGPSARIASYPREDSTTSNESCPIAKRPMTFCLESRECSEGPVARAVLVPTENLSSNGSDKITTLHIKKGDKHPDKPYSKVAYGPTIEETDTHCNVEERDAPVTFFGCTASKKQATARITKCLKNDRDIGAKRCFEARVPRDSDRPTAVGFICPPEKSAPCSHGILETKVDERGPETRMITFPRGEDYYGYMESKACEEGPTARIIQQSADTIDKEDRFLTKTIEEPASKFQCSPLNYAATCPSTKQPKEKHVTDIKRDLPTVKRRNGLDSSRVDKPNTSKREPRRQVCPAYCCQPTPRPKSCSNSFEPNCRKPRTNAAASGHGHQSTDRSKSCSSTLQQRPESQTDSTDVKTQKYLLVPCTVVDKTKDEIYENDTEDCTKPKGVPRITSEELLTRYREYMPSNILIRYEACRSKRNGLQDQCTLPVPNIVLELKRKEMQCLEGIDACLH